MKMDWNRKLTERELLQAIFLAFVLFFTLLVLQIEYYPKNVPYRISVPFVVVWALTTLCFFVYTARKK